ncbi:hypothetical protein Tco_1215266 [Tanacetum coccineum]
MFPWLHRITSRPLQGKLTQVFSIHLELSPTFTDPFVISEDPYMKAYKLSISEKSPIPSSNFIPPKLKVLFLPEDFFTNAVISIYPIPTFKLLRLGETSRNHYHKSLRANHGMPPKRASTTEAPAMTQDAIRKLVADSVTSALEAQAATMASASNPNRNTGPTKLRSKTGQPTKSLLAVNLSTLMVRKEGLALFAGLNEPNQYSLVADVLKKTK